METVCRLGRDGVQLPGAIVAVFGSTSHNKTGRETTKMPGEAVEDVQSGGPRMPGDRAVAKKVNRRFQRVTTEDTQTRGARAPAVAVACLESVMEQLVDQVALLPRAVLRRVSPLPDVRPVYAPRRQALHPALRLYNRAD